MNPRLISERSMKILGTTAVALAHLLVCTTGTTHADSRKALTVRVNAEKFNASRADIEAVCRSAGNQLMQQMEGVPEFTVEVSRGQHGPIALFQRGKEGQYLVRLATEKTFWAQYAYQFAHEICHVLCGYDNDYRGNLWFEETLCETASLYCLQSMSREWRTNPPYGNWRSYSPALFDYADNIRKGRKDYLEILHIGLPAYYQKHAAHLSGNPTDRKKNGAMALAILTLLERNPGHWDAIRWLNSSPSPQGETFLHYLTKWHRAVPPQHTKFVATIASLFGLSLPELPEPGKPIRQ
ncbi:MAG: hypothetical protein CMP30_02015 [Roseibacillus sp.]|nr:hypothetical protein [Roseibacillus sp.]